MSEDVLQKGAKMRMQKERRISRLLDWGRPRDEGFTLIELLVVIIVIAILAAIAIPTYLGQRAKAQDTNAYTLVRNSLTVVQSVFIDTNGYSGMTVDLLNECESTIHWVEATCADLVTVTGTPGIDASLDAEAVDGEVAFLVESNTCMDIASRSESGNLFGIQVDSQDVSNIGYVQVKVVAGEGSQIGW